jgi:protein ImuA
MSSDFSHHFPLRKGRTHEVCGPASLAFAFALARQTSGSTLWIQESWQLDQINPVGFSEYIDPNSLLVAKAKDQTEVLAVAEEGLRSGAVNLVIMELGSPIGFTAGRRLQLAAETRKSTGLCLIPAGTGSNASETRWQCDPVFDVTDSTLQSWKLIKNKTGTLGEWEVKWNVQAGRITVVSQTAQ